VEGNQAADGRPQKGGAIPRAAAIDLGCPFRNPAARNEDIDGVRGSLRAGRVEKRAAVWVDAESGAEGTAPAERTSLRDGERKKRLGELAREVAATVRRHARPINALPKRTDEIAGERTRLLDLVCCSHLGTSSFRRQIRHVQKRDEEPPPRGGGMRSHRGDRARPARKKR